MKRRTFVASASLGLLGSFSAQASTGNPPSAVALMTQCQMLEAQAKGRLGLYILDTGTGSHFGYRDNERFMLLSSFKVLASALVLHHVDIRKERLNRRIRYTQRDLIDGSPVSQKHLRNGMTLGQLCEATITTSDNTAANLILNRFGGPAALTAFLRHNGDSVTRLDRTEPALNRPGSDPLLDTTTPQAMAQTLRQLLVGDALSTKSRKQLQQWMLASTTGAQRIRAGVPKEWQVGDKTGTNATDANDVAIVRPPRRAPLIVTAYLADSSADLSARNQCLAAVGKIAASLSRDNSMPT